jgi:ParB family chromosome partitioning protein
LDLFSSPDSPSVQFNIEDHVDALNGYGNDGLWELGRYVAECLLPESQQHNPSKDKVLEEIASHPKARHPYSFLKQCLLFYTVYPDIASRQLPENYYFDLAIRVFDNETRGEYEEQALENGWNITQLRKAIRDGVLERREERRNELGFDLKVTNWWYFNSADPRFGKSSFRGRVAGQIIANALYFYAPPTAIVLDPFAGGGTLGDVIDKVTCFQSMSYKMYDLHPTDARIVKNDVILGIPGKAAVFDYIFLDPPYGSIPKGYYSSEPQDFSQMTNEAYLLGMKGLVSECWRTLKKGGKVSIVIEPYVTASSFYDLPSALASEFLKKRFVQIGKVYLPNQTMRRGDIMPYLINSAKEKRFMLSDCRELLTFQKP